MPTTCMRLAILHNRTSPHNPASFGPERGGAEPLQAGRLDALRGRTTVVFGSMPRQPRSDWPESMRRRRTQWAGVARARSGRGRATTGNDSPERAETPRSQAHGGRIRYRHLGCPEAYDG